MIKFNLDVRTLDTVGTIKNRVYTNINIDDLFEKLGNILLQEHGNNLHIKILHDDEVAGELHVRPKVPDNLWDWGMIKFPSCDNGMRETQTLTIPTNQIIWIWHIFVIAYMKNAFTGTLYYADKTEQTRFSWRGIK